MSPPKSRSRDKPGSTAGGRSASPLVKPNSSPSAGLSDDPEQLSLLEGQAASTARAPVAAISKSDGKAAYSSGHRKRLRDRLSAGGPEAMPDYELLELLLTLSIPRRDTKPLAKELIARFGSFAAALTAPEGRLLEVEGVGSSVVSQFRIVQAVAQRLARGQIMSKPALSSWTDVIDYLRIAQGFELKEQFRILFFDKKNVLIADEVQGRGTVDHTPVYVREVVKRALELSASAIILVHNHPSGDPTPSRADIDMTRVIVEAARMVGVAVHDHIIVGRNGHASLKALKLM